MSLIDTTYFTGPLTIAQLGQKAVDDSVKDFITLHEPDLLQAALGYEFYTSFTNGLTADPIDQKWLDILNGVEFVNLSSRKRKWLGFAGTTKISPIANYVYYKFQENKCMQEAGIGVVKSEAENATVISPAQKMAYAWNRMSEMLLQLWDFLQTNESSYTDDGYIYSEVNKCFFHPVNIFGI